MAGRRVHFNVSGLSYETYVATLERYPETLLGDAVRRQCFYNPVGDEFFFNCHRSAFESILYFYQSKGKLVRPSEIPMKVFVEQCRYFDLPESSVEEMKEREGYLEFAAVERRSAANLKEKIWYTLTCPEDSKPALFFSIASMITILLAFFIACIQSVSDYEHFVTTKGSPLHSIDTTLSYWFVVEVGLKTIFAPNKLAYLTRGTTVVDTLAAVPYFIVKALGSEQIKWFSFLRMLRLLRLVGILKIAVSSTKVELLGKILVSSLPDLCLLFMCLLIVVFLGASAMYMIECDVPDTLFTSVPESAWWALQTVVVLGYGDMLPTTTLGKAVATFFMLFGVVTLCLPVLSIASKFFVMYGNNMSRMQ